jgi:hypothetical protein
MDDDESQIVTAQEFYKFFIEKLGIDEGIDSISVHDIQRQLEHNFHDIGLSGTWDHAHKELVDEI